MRYLAAIGVVDEIGDKGFVANHITRNLAEDVSQSGISHWYAYPSC